MAGLQAVAAWQDPPPPPSDCPGPWTLVPCCTENPQNTNHRTQNTEINTVFATPAWGTMWPQGPRTQRNIVNVGARSQLTPAKKHQLLGIVGTVQGAGVRVQGRVLGEGYMPKPWVS